MTQWAEWNEIMSWIFNQQISFSCRQYVRVLGTLRLIKYSAVKQRTLGENLSENARNDFWFRHFPSTTTELDRC